MTMKNPVASNDQPAPDDLRDRIRGDYDGSVDDPGTASWILSGILAVAVVCGLFGERLTTIEPRVTQTTENVSPIAPLAPVPN